MWRTPKQFYNSEQWKKFRLNLIAERSMQHDGQIVCENCGRIIKSSGEAEVDHIKELTMLNLNDYGISLNPGNTRILCHTCHDIKHERFGTKRERNVTIVYGAPLSGKASYVRNNMVRGDLIVDMDRLFSAVSFFDLYDKPEILKQNVFAVRNLLIDNIKTRYGRFRNAWIIGGYPIKHDRERLANELGAKLVFINSTKEDCLLRLAAGTDNRRYQQAEWKRFIEKWFEEYQM